MAFGLSLILFSFSRHFWLSAALLIPTGFSMMVQMATSNTLLQMMTPDAYRGRVMSLYSMMFMGMAPIGAMLAGTLAGHIGAPLTVMLGGALSIIAGVGFGRRLRGLSFAAPEIIVAQPVAAGVPTQDTTDENLARDD
jgi:MFS family permease